ncbi:hypothetical protein BS50DRAFT_579838 [Corynespora cassiicola Philippines]|uniref:Uncharacterized protein n=1 Tax=Corynespora cassiicola Philippines TaxID=1448308 RepID=A0A2T2N2D9_CORCC|nr:hypothetical protein BS50DRAFT_579838 [Corynespora cassiicola Philippines]
MAEAKKVSVQIVTSVIAATFMILVNIQNEILGFAIIPPVPKPSVQKAISKPQHLHFRPKAIRKDPHSRGAFSYAKMTNKALAKFFGLIRYGGIFCFIRLSVVGMLVMPAAGVDHQIVPSGSINPASNATAEDRTIYSVITLITGLISIAISYLISRTASMLGPVMGTTSVLWIIMRNDRAVAPSLSWGVFLVWFLVALVYICRQYERVHYRELYIFVTLMTSFMFLVIISLVQKSSIEGGLLTAIPLCISFAAYSVGFCSASRCRFDSEPV